MTCISLAGDSYNDSKKPCTLNKLVCCQIHSATKTTAMYDAPYLNCRAESMPLYAIYHKRLFKTMLVLNTAKIYLLDVCNTINKKKLIIIHLSSKFSSRNAELSPRLAATNLTCTFLLRFEFKTIYHDIEILSCMLAK